MTEYRNGDRVRVTIEGTVRDMSGGCFTLVDRNGGNNNFYPRGDGSTVERLEPAYELGAMYVDSNDDVFFRLSDAGQHPWRCARSGRVREERYPTRPLRKLVPEVGADG